MDGLKIVSGEMQLTPELETALSIAQRLHRMRRRCDSEQMRRDLGGVLAQVDCLLHQLQDASFSVSPESSGSSI